MSDSYRPTLIEGGRRLPLHHISLRVPWHDTALDGRVCHDPRANTSCLILKNIAKQRDDGREASCADRAWSDLEGELPPCFSERGQVLSPIALTRKINHAYTRHNNEQYAHFTETPYQHAAYSAAAVPFRWMMRPFVEGTEQDGQVGLAEKLDLGYRKEREPSLGFTSNWVQELTNQRVLLDTFFGALVPGESLCFFYAKRTPLTDGPRRILMGVGQVTGIGRPLEYKYNRVPLPEDIRSTVWERDVLHSIRPDGVEGFMLPYQEILAKAALDASIDPRDFIVAAPDEGFEQFSYASEHVTHDMAIATLLAMIPVLERIGQVVAGPWQKRLDWLDQQLGRLWKMRGPFPGMGAALSAFGIGRGNLVAMQIAREQEKTGSTWHENPWSIFEAALDEPAMLGPELRGDLTKDLRRVYRGLSAERKALLHLVSRFELSTDQSARFYAQERRLQAGHEVTDGEILANPYLLYELDRREPDAIPAAVVDRGMFPDAVVSTELPVPAPSVPEGPADPRRVRAFLIETLEQAADEGHTLLLRDRAILRVNERGVKPRLPCTGDIMNAVEPSLPPAVDLVELKGGKVGYQLDSFSMTRKVIGDSVRLRQKGKRHVGRQDLASVLAEALPPLPEGTMREEELRARQEKVAALDELFASRLSVLIGPAGTGKTLLLQALCALPEVRKGGVLLLAPTGKARVRMSSKAAGLEARTVAQFLLTWKRYKPVTGDYLVTRSQEKEKAFKTVIIDECSMLTEDALAAILDALSGVERLILVGDPRQLPPIGTGRPFADLVRHLTPADLEQRFPRVAPCYAELTVVRRQREQADSPERDDVPLSSWFSGGHVHPGADEVWERLASGTASKIEAVRWENGEELEQKIVDKLVEHLGLSSDLDESGFEQRLGGSLFNGAVYFHAQGTYSPEGAASHAEAWQILSPVRAGRHGVDALNRSIQARFRTRVRAMADRETFVKVPRPAGAQEILYGDKVICVANGQRKDVRPKPEGKAYVANGEIGVVVGEYVGKAPKWGAPDRLQVEYASQPGLRYGYKTWEFGGEERSAPLELAYALTVHKAQGSEFGIVFLIVPKPCKLLSRELLYTALTRQEDRLVIFHQGDIFELRSYAAEKHSVLTERMTNLFEAPHLVETDHGWIDEGLIHRTMRGELVRSKSEVILANLLHSMDIPYEYELPLRFEDGTFRLPDFTVNDPETGEVLYLEHLGMMGDPAYRKRWERKLAWYRAHGVQLVSDGGGPNGKLLATTEGDGKGIDVPALQAQILEALGR